MNRLHALFVKNVAEHLRLRGWSQRQLASAIDMKHSQLNRYFTGANAPTLQVIEKVADAFGVPASRLIAEPESVTDIMDSLRAVRVLLQDLEAGDLSSPIVKQLLAAARK